MIFTLISSTQGTGMSSSENTYLTIKKYKKGLTSSLFNAYELGTVRPFFKLIGCGYGQISDKSNTVAAAIGYK